MERSESASSAFGLLGSVKPVNPPQRFSQQVINLNTEIKGRTFLRAGSSSGIQLS